MPFTGVNNLLKPTKTKRRFERTTECDSHNCDMGVIMHGFGAHLLYIYLFSFRSLLLGLVETVLVLGYCLCLVEGGNGSGVVGCIQMKEIGGRIERALSMGIEKGGGYLK
jgi:hypothetical protein